MNCSKCQKKAVIKLQHASYCKDHFLSYLEEKVFKTIKKFKLIEKDDIVCIATSGGKDSITALYHTHMFCKKHNIKHFALMIDEGIADYREHTYNDLKKFCKEFEIDLKIASFEEEFGRPLDKMTQEAMEKYNKKPCSVCGILRRFLLNKYSRENKATKIVTGHNLDDESQVLIMNTFKNNIKLNARLGPLGGIGKVKGLIQRIKPLYFVSEKESRLFCILKGFDVSFSECPYVQHSYRARVRDYLNKFEEEFPGTKNGILNSFIEIRESIKSTVKEKNNLTYCEKCGEPASNKICKTCQLVEELKLK